MESGEGSPAASQGTAGYIKCMLTKAAAHRLTHSPFFFLIFSYVVLVLENFAREILQGLDYSKAPMAASPLGYACSGRFPTEGL